MVMERWQIQKVINKDRMKILVNTIRKYLNGKYKDIDLSDVDDDFKYAKYARRAIQDYDGGVDHVWYDGPKLETIMYRKGNPPSNADRPNWAKDLSFELDPRQVPESIWVKLLPGGYFDNMIRNYSEYMGSSLIEKPYDFNLIKPVSIL